MEIKERLQQIREEKKLSKRAVSDGSGIPYNTYIKYEYGEREIGVQSLQKLADFYGVSTDYLLGRPNAEPPADPIDNLVKKMTVQEMEADLMHRWLGLSPKAREAFLQVLREIVHEDDKRKQAKESEKNDTDYITVSTTLVEIEDQMKAEEDVSFKEEA